MTKRYLLLSFALILVLSSCIVRSSLMFFDSDTVGVPNLLFNPGFNAYSLDPAQALKGWSVITEPQGGDNRMIVIDTNQAFEGQTSLRIDASEKTVMIMSDAFQVERYGGYYVRLHARSSHSAGPQVSVRFISFRQDGRINNRFNSKIKTGTDWKKGSISAGYLKPGVSFGRVAIMVPPFSEGSVWLDNAGCWKVHHFKID
ncbi:MAG: hypothetical protein U1B83_03380 [Candidatus Cloacimonadaceae bacterium]|nr:hypothetical protein [Candidatus Cloacimonadaceae bacterium]